MKWKSRAGQKPLHESSAKELTFFCILIIVNEIFNKKIYVLTVAFKQQFRDILNSFHPVSVQDHVW